MFPSRPTRRTGLSWESDWIQPGAEVFAARLEGRPLVALESTIIAHGLPWPQNLETASEMEDAVRAEGAVPATIALWEGRIQIGVDADGLKQIARGGFSKTGVRDLPFALSQKTQAATTVSSTLQIASDLGIPILATGGIGGVHPGPGGDVSSDLTVLSRCPVLVVCSGAKSVLDLARTLEALETLGVPVAGYQTSSFPGFLTRHSGLLLDHRLDDPVQVAALFRTLRDLGGGAGLILANPVPKDTAIPAEDLADWTRAAQRAAQDQGISGKNLTPFLLEQIQQASQGRALAANHALAVSNSRLAAQIAVQFRENQGPFGEAS